MDRRLLFPAVAVTAWAQQTSPATAEAEKALRARAEQFYQLEAEKKYRQAEGFVAEDSKDYYYDHDKPDNKGYRIDKIEFTDATHAKVTLLVSTILRAPGFPSQAFTVPQVQNWKLDKGEWAWYFVQSDTIDTPFGKWKITSGDGAISTPPGMPADLTSLQKMLTIDRTAVELVADSQKVESVTISNHLPGLVNLEIGADRPQGLLVTIDKKQLGRDEKAVVSFSAVGSAKPSGTVRIDAGPLQQFLIQIKTK